MKKVKLPASMNYFDSMMSFILSKLEELPCNDKTTSSKLRLACEEALLNVIKYAYNREVGYVEIVCKSDRKSKKIILEIVDEGVEFNPLEARVPKLNMSLEERVAGGLGVYIMKEVMDDLRYRREGEKNILTLVKFIG
ncbi:ATP-binding protein [Halonatronum saccharophilum]|uniref:ATP-binding protein n=1 Tax=Halonatronum saccharophilum TaxID=150060 RepID=UPI0004AEEDB8|nr:ATP-binding protein [Halonatronum saccharophilum]